MRNWQGDEKDNSAITGGQGDISSLKALCTFCQVQSVQKIHTWKQTSILENDWRILLCTAVV